MAQAGFDPRAAVNLWQNMIGAGGSRPQQWLSTHPDPQARIGELQSRASGLLATYEQARANGQIGRAHVCTPVTNALLVCRLLLETKHQTLKHTSSRIYYVRTKH